MPERFEELLKRLDENGNIGLDFSPGNPVEREAAEAIRQLLREVGPSVLEATQGDGS